MTFTDGGVAITGCEELAVQTGNPVNAAADPLYGTVGCTEPFPGSGSPHAILATYSGDPNHTLGSSNEIGQSVRQAITQTTLGASASPAGVGQPLTYTATVSPPPGGGTVVPGCGAVVPDPATGAARCPLVAGRAPVVGVVLSAAAKVKLVLTVQKRSGKKLHWVKVAALTKSLKAGKNQVKVIATKSAAGKYRVTAAATAAGGGTAAATKVFVVVAGG